MSIRVVVEINSDFPRPGDLGDAVSTLAVLFNNYHCDVALCPEKATAIIPLYGDFGKPATGARLVCEKHKNGY